MSHTYKDGFRNYGRATTYKHVHAARHVFSR